MDIDVLKWRALLEAQDAVVAIAQALDCGWTRAAIAHRCAVGSWQAPLPGVLLTVSGEPTVRQRQRCALLHGGAGSAIGAATACAHYGLERIVVPERLQITVGASAAPRSAGFVEVLPTTRPFTVEVVDGLHVVPIARAVVDAALRMPDVNDVRALVAESVQRRRIRPAALVAELARAPMRGSKHLRQAIDEVADGARSAPEGVLLRALRATAGLPPYELNANVYDNSGRWLACSDVVFRAQRVVVEVDGMRWHLSPERWTADVERHTRLEAAGWTVLRYPAARVFADAAGVAAQIAAVLASRQAA